VAAPVTVYFGVEPVDKAAVARHVTLTSVPAVQGAWAWIQHNDGRWALDYRTKDYWPAGTKVHVSAQLYGVPLAPGSFGAADITTDFTIGRNQVVIADVNSHEMVVQRDGATVALLPGVLRPWGGHRGPEPDHPLRDSRYASRADRTRACRPPQTPPLAQLQTPRTPPLPVR